MKRVRGVIIWLGTKHPMKLTTNGRDTTNTEKGKQIPFQVLQKQGTHTGKMSHQ